jgi:hypothetical protein
MTLWNDLLLKNTRKINLSTTYLLMVALYTWPCRKTSFVRQIQGLMDVLMDLWLPKLFRNMFTFIDDIINSYYQMQENNNLNKIFAWMEFPIFEDIVFGSSFHVLKVHKGKLY